MTVVHGGGGGGGGGGGILGVEVTVVLQEEQKSESEVKENDQEKPRPKRKKKETALSSLVLSKSLKKSIHGYSCHRERIALWQGLVDGIKKFAVDDPRIKAFHETVQIDITDGTWPSPLLVTTCPFQHEDNSVQFGILSHPITPHNNPPSPPRWLRTILITHPIL